MSTNHFDETRLKFYGMRDYGTYFQVDRAKCLLANFDPAQPLVDTNDAVELYNLIRFLEQHALAERFDEDFPKSERDQKVAQIRRAIGIFASTVTDARISAALADIDFQYHTDVLELFAQQKVYDRCTASAVLTALDAAGIPPGDTMTCESLVKTYSEDVRQLLLRDPTNAELLIAHYLSDDERQRIVLPKTWKPTDSRNLIKSYLETDRPNLNFTRLVASARSNRSMGIDDALRLQARRKSDQLNDALFEQGESFRSGCEVSFVRGQEEAVSATLDGHIAKYSYSREWLEENLDYPTILNNFIHLFEFATPHMLLNLPSFPSELGVTDVLFGSTARESYRRGAAYKLKDQSSLLQTAMYDRVLEANGVNLQQVLEWFFEEYLKEEFGADGFRFQPASETATYLEKSRHLFSEMESVIKQFTLYVDNGEIDPELLSMSSSQVSFGDIPSLGEGKYVYPSEDPEIHRLLALLFSDQSSMCYIDAELRDRSLARLIIKNDVLYEQFREYQQRELDWLISIGAIERGPSGMKFRSTRQFDVFRELYDFGVAVYYRFSEAGRAEVDLMIDRGWVETNATLLTKAEVSYFNFFLNQSEFSDGPDLRNRYLHGTQTVSDDDTAHRQTYVIALRLLVALVIKINDDFDQASDSR